MQYLKFRNEEERKSIRRQGIGGSDAAAVMGFSPWRTPYDVWAEKVQGVEPEAKNPEALEYGKYAEKWVADTYQKRTGYAVRNYNFTISDGCLQGNIDRLVSTVGGQTSHKSEIRADVILECKTTNDYSWESVPVFYQAQVQHYLGLVPVAVRADVAVLYKPTGITQIFQVERDDATIHDMQAYLRDWWEKHVVKGEAPAPICEADVKKIWKRSNPGKTVVATQDVMDTAQALWEIRQGIKDMEAEAKTYVDEIACFMGDGEKLMSPQGHSILMYKTYNDQARFDKDAIIDELAKRLSLTREELAAIRLQHVEKIPGRRPITFRKMFYEREEN